MSPEHHGGGWLAKVGTTEGGYVYSIGEDTVTVGDTTQDREEGKYCAFSLLHAIHPFLSVAPMDQPTKEKKNFLIKKVRKRRKQSKYGNRSGEGTRTKEKSSEKEAQCTM